ncbi:LysR family transcriptional regulator [Vibrio hibernica]|uniref:LysR family transcriptional regulator n=1 Tax=Vibrio hibernica TaxID=2587465 RepID=UPI001881080B|nr:LysR family transcriptional regulator [Vibrio hibernica]
MNNKELNYFVTLIRAKNFTRASEQLFVTQPTISKALKSLESSVGGPLIHRNNRDIRLTEAGSIVYRYGEEILQQFNDMQVKLHDLQQLESGTLSIGIPPMVGHLYADTLHRFQVKYPKVEVSIVEFGSRKIESAIHAGDIDLGITMLPLNQEQLKTKIIVTHPVYVVLAKNSGYSIDQTIDIVDLQQHTFYLYREEFALTAIIEQLCQDNGFQPRVGVRSTQWDFLAAMVKSGLGVTFLPAPICARLNSEHYDFIELKQEIKWELGICWSSQRYLSHAAKAFLALF